MLRYRRQSRRARKQRSNIRYMKAALKNFRQSPRKMLLVAKTLRGKKVTQALETLQLINKKAAQPLHKLIASAMSNAQVQGKKNAENLVIKDIKVDQGVTLKRWRPRAFGRATPIRKRASSIQVELQ